MRLPTTLSVSGPDKEEDEPLADVEEEVGGRLALCAARDCDRNLGGTLSRSLMLGTRVRPLRRPLLVLALAFATPCTLR